MNGIQVKNLVKTYTTQSTDIILNGAKRPSTTRTVLHGVSVDFPAGKLTAILGRSGCGKSTLLRLIDGTKDAPDSGEIVMPEGWRCALLSPDPYVITWTSVERNVAMAAGAGRTPESKPEGFCRGGLYATALIGPLLILNPPLCKWLLRQMGAEDTLAFEDAAFASFNKRVAEFKEPGRGFQYS